MLSSFVNGFLTKTGFCIHIKHYFINLTWFALLSDQKFDARPPLKPALFCLVCRRFELSQNKYFS